MFSYEDSTPEEYRAAKEGETVVGYNNKGLMQRREPRFNPSEAAAKQVGGNHYKIHSIQPWDIIDMYGLDYHRGNAIKYILRNKMNPREDIEKAIHYLEHWLEVSDAD